MIKAKEEFLTLGQIVGAVRKRAIGILFLSGLLSMLGLIALMSLRDVYVSEGGFYLNAGRGTVTIDPTATTSQTANLMDTRQSEVQSIKDMLVSRMMLERTARRVGMDRLLEQRSWLDAQKESVMEYVESKLGITKSVEAGLTLEQMTDLERLQGSVEYLADRITIWGDKDGNTIQIRAKAHTSLLAHDIVAALMTEFQEQYVKVHRTVGSQDFFDNEYESAQQRVRQAEQELAAYKNKMKAISIESKRDLLHKESEVLQDDLLKTEAEIVAKRAEIERLEMLIAAEPQMMSTQATARSSAASDSMRADLYRLEVAESELAAKYSDEHPLLIKARQALNESREAFKQQDAQFDEKAESINPVRQELMITKLKAASSLEALMARKKSLDESMAANETKIEQLNGDEIKVAELTRSLDVIREELKTYSHKREESRRQAELDEALISALQVSQDATHVIQKSGPPRLIGLFIIGVFSLAFSCAIAIYRESTNTLESLSPLEAYGKNPQVFNRTQAVPDAKPEENYTILSGRIMTPEPSKFTATGSAERSKVHVTENIRG